MNKKLFIGAVLLAMTPFLITQGCGQMAYGPVGSFEAASSSGSGGGDTSSGGGTTYSAPSPVSNPVALLSSEQVLKSMSSVTGVAVSSTIMTEYNTRSSVLGTGYDLSLVNSPMLIGLTNLASQFCKQLVSNEQAQASASRRFMASVDFTKGVNSVTDANYTSAVSNMAAAFWGRLPTADESTILLQGKMDFVSALSGSGLTSAAGSANLMVYACTGMLSSFEAYSF